MTIYKCNICNKEYSSNKGLISHMNFHKEGYKEKHISNRPKSLPKLLETNSIKREKSIIEYENNPKLCLECNTPIPYDKRHNKFFTRNCAAKYNNRHRILPVPSQERKEELRQHKIQKFIDSKTCKKYLPIEDKICISCNKPFTPDYNIRGNINPRKTCSKECLVISNKKHGSISGKISAKKRQLRSKKEIELFELCQSYYTNVLSNHIIADSWDADIVLPDHKVAILWNGPWHYKDMGIKGVSLSQIQNRDRIKTKLFESLDWKVIAFRDDCVTPSEAFNILLETL